MTTTNDITKLLAIINNNDRKKQRMVINHLYAIRNGLVTGQPRVTYTYSRNKFLEHLKVGRLSVNLSNGKILTTQVEDGIYRMPPTLQLPNGKEVCVSPLVVSANEATQRIMYDGEDMPMTESIKYLIAHTFDELRKHEIEHG